MKITIKELKQIIAEELEGLEPIEEEETEEERNARIRTPRKSKMIDGVLYPLPLRMLYKLFGLDEGESFRDSYVEEIRHLLMKKKNETITDEEEKDLVTYLSRFELSEDKNEDR